MQNLSVTLCQNTWEATMATNKYTGEPIDLTDGIGETHLSEVNGTTVGSGHTDDDLFKESTVKWPDHIDEDDLSESQVEVIEAYLSQSNRDITPSKLAENNDFSPPTARRALHKVFREYRNFDDLGDSKKLAILALAHHGFDVSHRSLSEKYPVSRTVIGDAKRTYPDLVKEQQPITQDEMDEVVEKYLEKHPAKRDGSTNDNKNDSQTNPNSSSSQKKWPDDFSEIQRWFVNKIVEYPAKTSYEIAKEIPTDSNGERQWSEANYHNVVRSHAKLIGELINEKGTVDEYSNLNDYLQKHIPKSLFGVGRADEGKKDSSDTERVEPEQLADVENRLASLESKIESLQERANSMELDNSKQPQSVNNDIARIVVESMSDEQIANVVRGAIDNE